MDTNLELKEGQPPSGGRYSMVAREDNDEQRPVLDAGTEGAVGGSARDDGSSGTDAAHTSVCARKATKQHHTYEIAGEALDSIGRVATEEGRKGRVVGAEELQASTAVVNDRLVRTILSMWRPEYTVVGVRAFAGACHAVAAAAPSVHRRT